MALMVTTKLLADVTVLDNLGLRALVGSWSAILSAQHQSSAVRCSFMNTFMRYLAYFYILQKGKFSTRACHIKAN